MGSTMQKCKVDIIKTVVKVRWAHQCRALAPARNPFASRPQCREQSPKTLTKLTPLYFGLYHIQMPEICNCMLGLDI